MKYILNETPVKTTNGFKINDIEITLNDTDFYHTTVETNSSGKAITQIPFGRYRITETKAPEGYELNNEPTIIELAILFPSPI